MSVNSPVHAAAREFQRGLDRIAQRDSRAAVHHFLAAERLGYDPDACASRRWHCWMNLGEFGQAWRESDLIATRGGPDPNALWDGSPFANKRVIIRCLHGYGDAIQFLRYAGLVRQTASRVMVETHPEMVSVLRGIVGVDVVITWDVERRQSWDQQIEVMELPRAFRTTLSTIPCTVPYLKISAPAQARSLCFLQGSREQHSRTDSRPRVGLLWASSAWNPARSVELAALLPILSLDCCTFYSFQRGPGREALTSLSSRLHLHDTFPHSPDIADTAADLMNMDLLITVDTMAAHLAGALGRKVWVMLPWDADWRWLQKREDSPWYPTMKLFRQPSPGNWESVIRRVAASLLQFAESFGTWSESCL
jgi:hypothetical protein